MEITVVFVGLSQKPATFSIPSMLMSLDQKLFLLPVGWMVLRCLMLQATMTARVTSLICISGGLISKTGAVVDEQLDDTASEFPRVNEQWLGRSTRYGYTARMVLGTMPLFDGLIKYDLLTGKSQTHFFGQEGRYGGEGVFVPHPDATAEDHGWLLTFVYDRAEQKSELVVVSAQDVTAEPVARIIIPQRVPYGFHGTWITESQMAKSKAAIV